MLRRNSHDKFWPSRLLTIALAIWLSGMGCLFCCETPVSAETGKAESCATDDDCATGADEAHVADDCCAEPVEHSNSSPCQKECCKMDGASYDLPRAPHFIQSHAILASAAWDFVLPDTASPSTTIAGQLPLSNQRETHLRYCVFLI